MESQASAVNKYYMSQRVRKPVGLKETGHQTPQSSRRGGGDEAANGSARPVVFERRDRFILLLLFSQDENEWPE